MRFAGIEFPGEGEGEQQELAVPQAKQKVRIGCHYYKISDVDKRRNRTELQAAAINLGTPVLVQYKALGMIQQQREAIDVAVVWVRGRRPNQST